MRCECRARHERDGKERQGKDPQKLPHIPSLMVHGRANPLTALTAESSNRCQVMSRAGAFVGYGTKMPCRRKGVSSPSPHAPGQPAPKPVPFGPGSSTRIPPSCQIARWPLAATPGYSELKLTVP